MFPELELLKMPFLSFCSLVIMFTNRVWSLFHPVKCLFFPVFLVVGAATRLPSPVGVLGAGGVNGVAAEAESVVAVKPFGKWDVNKVYGLVKSIGYAEAADAIKENCVDGKTLISAGFDQYLTMGIAEGGLGLKPMQKIRLKTEIEQFRKPSHSVWSWICDWSWQ